MSPFGKNIRSSVLLLVRDPIGYSTSCSTEHRLIMVVTGPQALLVV